MGDVINMLAVLSSPSTIERETSRLGQAIVETIEPMGQLGEPVWVLDYQLEKIALTLNAIGSGPGVTALNNAVLPVRNELLSAANRLADEIDTLAVIFGARH
jgi:hypothetical protein